MSALPGALVLDVGANVGQYSSTIRSLSPTAKIFAFEAHPLTFKVLEESGTLNHFEAIHCACSDETGSITLYDHIGATDVGSQHASIFRDVIENTHADEASSWDVNAIRLEDFLRDRDIVHVDLLKIDVEGAEMKVLNGLSSYIQNGSISVIHFEFTESNIINRLFMSDFVRVLHDYEFYRMLPDGLVSMGPYFSPIYEIFAYQNIVAVRNDLSKRIVI